MGFRFSMESVLRYREGIEQREELTLQKMQFEIDQVQRLIDELTKGVAKASDERGEALLGWIRANRLKDIQDEINIALETRKSLFEFLVKLKSQHAAQMKVYQTARANRRMLTDLEKQQREIWEKKQARAEQKRIDDIFTSRLQRG